MSSKDDAVKRLRNLKESGKDKQDNRKESMDKTRKQIGEKVEKYSK